MVAYEQEHNAGSRSFASCPPPSVQSICWELHSLHGRTGALVLRWFKAALEQLLPLLAPLDAGEPTMEHTRCPACCSSSSGIQRVYAQRGETATAATA